jgi:hypothetical protein
MRGLLAARRDSISKLPAVKVDIEMFNLACYNQPLPTFRPGCKCNIVQLGVSARHWEKPPQGTGGQKEVVGPIPGLGAVQNTLDIVKNKADPPKW